MNVRASPMPTNARAATATGSDSVSANVICADAMISAPAAIILREPIRSSSTPAGICIAAYTTTCSTTNEDNRDGEIENRSAALSPATPKAVRCSTPMTYAKTPMPHTTHTVLPVLTVFPMLTGRLCQPRCGMIGPGSS